MRLIVKAIILTASLIMGANVIAAPAPQCPSAAYIKQALNKTPTGGISTFNYWFGNNFLSVSNVSGPAAAKSLIEQTNSSYTPTAKPLGDYFYCTYQPGADVALPNYSSHSAYLAFIFTQVKK